tara:strand:+ start:73 stop:654 length:582 start_codon:yes stop_codon:yes gene_type:complete
MNKKEHHKIVFLGASGVGKSSIAMRYVRDAFFEYNEPTIGAAFLTMPVSCEGREISLDIWDTAGQERYSSLAPMYYRGASAAIIVYDITSIESLNQAKRWVREVRGSIDNCPIVLVGNKLDLDSLRQVSLDDATDYAQEFDMHVVETSAKTSLNIDKIFQNIISSLPKKTSPPLSTVITEQPMKVKKSCKCSN